MNNIIELILKGRKDNSVEAAIASTRRDLDAIAAKAKATPLTPKVEVKPIVDAKARITELERTLQSWQRVAARGGTIMPGDLSQIQAAKSEIAALKRGLEELHGKTVQPTGLSNQGFGRVGEALQGAGLGGIVGAASVAGVAALAVGAGKAVIELGNLGQTVRQQKAYFDVWSGGVENATRNLDAMRRAVGNSMTDTEMMTGANRLLSMGLAKNADDLERLSKMAVMLGGSTRSANESIEEFSLLLANQSILRLDTFGLSGARVRERIEELQEATKGLSREQAFLQAVMEQGAVKVQALEAAGVKATTATQDLETSWRGLREEIGQGINTSGLFGEFAKQINDLTRSLRIDAGRGTISDLQTEIELLQATMTRDLGGKPKWLQDWIRLASDIPERIQEIDYKIKAASDDWNDVGVGIQVSVELPGVEETKSKISSWWQSASAQQYALAISAQVQSATPVPAQPGRINWWNTANASAYALAMRGDTQATAGQTWADLLADKQTKSQEDAAKESARAWDSEFKKVSSRIQGYLQQGITQATGLFDVKQDIFKPGNNGAFENLYRALDVAKQGDASPWAKVLGMTQEQARKVSEDFQRGIFSDEVMGLVNVDALVNEAKLAELAEKTQEKFAKSIASKAGVKTNLVSNLFGFGSTGDGEKAGAAAEKQVSAAMNQVAVSIGDSVKGKDFAGKVIGYGETLWGYFEKGIVDSAKQSDGLQQAIDGMVAKAISKQGATVTGSGNGVQGAARSSGVPGI